MLRRFLACLVALALALPSAGAGAVSLVPDRAASARQASVECDCAPGENDCASRKSACDCSLACVARIVVVEPAIAIVMTVFFSAADASVSPMARAAPLSNTFQDAPFRPPRSTIPD